MKVRRKVNYDTQMWFLGNYCNNMKSVTIQIRIFGIWFNYKTVEYDYFNTPS